MSPHPLVQVKDLTVGFHDRGGGWRPVLKRVNLSIARKEKVGLIGASGSGKSLTALAALGLAPPTGRISGGEVLVDGRNLLTMAPALQQQIRGQKIGFVFQEAGTALNPVMTVGAHFKEMLRTHEPEMKRNWRVHATNLLNEVGLDSARTLASYCHQLSGGQQQRVMLALALSCRPELVIADEPTSSLDLLTQARVLRLLAEACSRRGASLLLISHDLDVVASAVDRVVVMLEGRIVEESSTSQIIENPLHPFTRTIVASHQVNKRQREHLKGAAEGCPYAPICPCAITACLTTEPELLDAGDGRRVRCPVVLGRTP